MRSAWKTRVAGWMRSLRAGGVALSIACASSRVPVKGALAHDHARQAPTVTLLTIAMEQIGQFLLAAAVDQAGGVRNPGARVEAHVQGPVAAQREAAFGAIQLH